MDSGFLELDYGFQSLGFSDHYTFLGICLPLLPLSQRFARSKKYKVFMLAYGRGRWVDPRNVY